MSFNYNYTILFAVLGVVFAASLYMCIHNVTRLVQTNRTLKDLKEADCVVVVTIAP